MCVHLHVCYERNLCLQIKIGFLPVGHTHEDIDQLFSRVSRLLKHRNALTIPGTLTHTYVGLTSFLLQISLGQFRLHLPPSQLL